MLLTETQRSHINSLHEQSNKHLKSNWNYGNALSAMMFLYQDFYILKNRHAELFQAYSELVDKYQKTLEQK